MEKIRLFATPHKGLRNILSQFSLLLGSTDYQNKDELNLINNMSYELFAMLDDHVKVEEEMILAPLEKRDPGTTNHDHADHIKIERKQKELEQKLYDLLNDPTPQKGNRLYLDFTRFQGRYLTHIFYEEVITEQFLWKNFTQEELLEIRSNIIKNKSAEMLLIWWKYIIPAQKISDSAEMLTALKKRSYSLFEEMMEILQIEMPAQKFALINRQIEQKFYSENGVL